MAIIFGLIKAPFSAGGMTHCVPIREKVLLGTLYLLMVFLSNTALIYVSYPLQLLARNTKLLVIFLVGIYFSRLKKTGHGTMGHSKLIIGGIITTGVIIFNLFGVYTLI